MLPFKIVNTNGKPYVETIHHGKKVLKSPEEISALILMKLKESAEAAVPLKDLPDSWLDQKSMLSSAGKSLSLKGLLVEDLSNLLSLFLLTLLTAVEQVGSLAAAVVEMRPMSASLAAVFIC